MSISYSAWTFYGAKAPGRDVWESGADHIYDMDDVLKPLELRKVKEETGVDIGYMSLHGYDEEGQFYLTFGECYGGDLNYSRVLSGIRFAVDFDPEYANACLAQVYEKLGWDFEVSEPGWYTGGSVG